MKKLSIISLIFFSMIIFQSYNIFHGKREAIIEKSGIAEKLNEEIHIWPKRYGGEDYDYGFSVRQTTDGGYIIAGKTEVNARDDVYLIKVDANGNETWEKTFGSSNNDDIGYFAQQTIDGGYIVIGEYNKYSVSNISKAYLIKVDANGNKLWEKTFGNENAGGFFGQETIDNGYIIVGYIYTWYLEEEVYLIKTDADGNTNWSKTYGGSDDDRGLSVQQTADNGYIITGVTKLSDYDSDVYLIKTDVNGNTNWTKTFGTYGFDYGFSVRQTTDGGYIIAGTTENFRYGYGYDVYLIKVDANGNKLWDKAFGGSNDDWGYSVWQTSDGNYIITGETKSFSASYDVYLIKVDANGNEVWEKTFGDLYHDYGHSVQQTTDGSYIICGGVEATATAGFGLFDVYLIKTDAGGNIQ